MTQANLPKTLPLLPGYQFIDRQDNYHKTQQFSINQSTQCEKIKNLQEEVDMNLLDSLQASMNNANFTQQVRPQENTYIPRIQPPWLKYDRQVLRFTAYYQESVVENPTENYRIIPVTIYYYLSDDTIHINTNKSVNSGLVQSKFLNRSKVPKQKDNNYEHYHWQDLDIGMNINFYERVFRIVDCDEFTRQYYQYMGVKLNDQNEQIPIDAYKTFTQLRDIKVLPPDSKEYNEYNEVKRGGGHPNTGLQKYIANDRKVLSFSVLWDDNSLEGGTNFYQLNFFLADETIEIKEVRNPNSGKEKFPLLLNRKKIPKTPIQTHYPGMTLKKEEFYSPNDLICGDIINVYSKDLLIYDCDEFTKQWYKVNKNIIQQITNLKNEKFKKFYQPIPPYNGFGTKEDSLGSVFYLDPSQHVPYKDLNKMYTQDQYILRFECRLITENSEDRHRNFTMSFFCGDDTIMVYENADKNSGIWGGKFLERHKYENPMKGTYYNEKEFQIGEVIQILVYKFQILRADEYTHKYMKTKPQVFKEANIQFVLDRMLVLAQKYPSLEEFLIDLIRKMDANRNGKIEFDELVKGMKALGFNLSYQELYTLMRYFDTDGDWKLSMQELFCGLGGQK